MNNVLTASRIGCFMRCPRAHFWQFEIGLRKEETGLALRIGAAWALAMEARRNGANYQDALKAALPEGGELSGHDAETVAALLAGYYDRYGDKDEHVAQIYPEVQIPARPLGGTEFVIEGKIDGLGAEHSGRLIIYEDKTTGESLDSDSGYWMRLAFNMQILQYVCEARMMGWDVSSVFYNVTRKPSIRPKMVDDLDADGLKIVLDYEGNRVFLQSGKDKGKPRQTGDREKGYTVQQHLETPEEYSERLWQDTKARPEFYYARREVGIADDDLVTFERQRLAIAQLIAHLRSTEEYVEALGRDADAWPRNVSRETCNVCAYRSFCLSNHSIDINHPPEGFAIKPFNPELNHYDDSTTEDTSAS